MGAHAQKNDHTHKTQETNYWNKFLMVFEPIFVWQQIGKWLGIFSNDMLIRYCSDINDRDIKRVNIKAQSRSITFCNSSIITFIVL